MEASVDSCTLSSVVAKDSNTTDRCLHIDIFGLKEIYQKEELKRMGWFERPKS